jgi:hypothetical protein
MYHSNVSSCFYLGEGKRKRFGLEPILLQKINKFSKGLTFLVSELQNEKNGSRDRWI